VMATGLPKPIPDLGTAMSAVTITRPGTVLSVRIVDLVGTHTYTGDLRFSLTSPSGTEVVLFESLCGGGQNFDLDLAGTGYATDPIPCPLTGGGLYVAEALDDFIGETAAGNWTLTVRDMLAQDSGQLASFGLEVCSTCGDGTLGGGEMCDDGNAVDGDCCSSDCQSAAADGTACSSATECVLSGSCSAGTCSGAVQCDPCLTCQPPLGCVPPANVLCDSEPARRSTVKLTDDPTRPDRDSLSWSWTSGYPVAALDFGNPSQVTDLTLCVFDQTGLKLSATAPAAGTCHGRSCWSTAGGKVKYTDRDLTPDGLLKIVAKPGDPGKAKITVKGKGENLGMPSLGLAGTVTVRLKRSGGPACWQAKFPAASRNDAQSYKASIRP
jgi:cysteine-rich repeat protein